MRSGKAESYCLIENLVTSDSEGGRFWLDGTQNMFGDYLGLGLKWDDEDNEFKNLYNNMIEVHNCQQYEFSTTERQRGLFFNAFGAQELYLTSSSHTHDNFSYFNEGIITVVHIFRTRDDIFISKMIAGPTTGETDIDATCSIMLRRIG